MPKRQVKNTKKPGPARAAKLKRDQTLIKALRAGTAEAKPGSVQREFAAAVKSGDSPAKLPGRKNTLMRALQKSLDKSAARRKAAKSKKKKR